MLTCLSLVAFAGENLVKNGDFEKRTSRWSGDLKISSEGDNKICKLELEDDEAVSFHQKIVLQEPEDLILRFKVKKSDDYTGNDEVGIRFDEEHASMVSSRMIPDNNEWNEVVFNYTNFRGAKRIKVILIVNQGAGALYFDDIGITAKD